MVRTELHSSYYLNPTSNCRFCPLGEPIVNTSTGFSKDWESRPLISTPNSFTTFMTTLLPQTTRPAALFREFESRLQRAIGMPAIDGGINVEVSYGDAIEDPSD